MNKKMTFAFMGIVALNGMVLNAQAAQGNIKFTGAIQNAGCDIMAATNNQTVNLGTVSKKEFVNANDVAAATGFNIELEKCPASVAATNKVALKFDGQPDATNPNLLKLLAPASATAPKGVGIGIYNRLDNTMVPLFSKSLPVTIDYTGGVSAGKAKLEFLAKYVATTSVANITEGQVEVPATFSIMYE